jgi:hypothetical protein
MWLRDPRLSRVQSVRPPRSGCTWGRRSMPSASRIVASQRGFELRAEPSPDRPSVVRYQVYSPAGEPLRGRWGASEDVGRRKLAEALLDASAEGDGSSAAESAAFPPPESPTLPASGDPGGVEDDLYGEEGRPSVPTASAPDWTVQVVKSEKSVFELHRQFSLGRLELRPLFQREFVWKRDQQVRLVESVLARIPLPAIYLSDESEDRSLVIDGQQRLTTLFEYLGNKWPVRGLQLLPSLDNRTFEQLEPRMQRRIEDTPLTVFSIQPGSDPQVKFYLFERLNQGGVSLNAQEIRNGIFRGPGLDLVQQLGREGGPFRAVAGTWRTYARMKADELVLRALALQELGVEPYPGDMETYLNRALTHLNSMKAKDLERVGVRFSATLRTIIEVFGADAFRRVDPRTGATGHHLNAAIMDALTWGFGASDRPQAAWTTKKAVRSGSAGL